MPRSKTYHRKRLKKVSSRIVSNKRKRVSFYATEAEIKRKRVSFRTKEGRRVSFVAKERVPKKVKITFYSKKHKR